MVRKCRSICCMDLLTRGVTFLILSTIAGFTVDAQTLSDRITINVCYRGNEEDFGIKSKVYLSYADGSKEVRETDEGGSLVLDECKNSKIIATPLDWKYTESSESSIDCPSRDEIIKLKVIKYSTTYLIRNWRQAIVNNELGVAALIATEWASRQPADSTKNDLQTDLDPLLLAGEFDEAIAITERWLGKYADTNETIDEYSILSKKEISRENARSLAVVFAKHAFDVDDGGVVFDGRQGRAVMTEKMEAEVLHYQALHDLQRTGKLDYATLSQLANTEIATLMYSEWRPSGRPVMFQLLSNLESAIRKKNFGIASLVATELAYSVYGLGRRHSQIDLRSAFEIGKYDDALWSTADLVRDYKRKSEKVRNRPTGWYTAFPTKLFSRKTAASLAVIFAKHALGAGNEAIVYDKKQEAVVMTKNMKEVIRKYQVREGIKSNGELNYPTLSRLAGGVGSANLMYSTWPSK